MIYIKGKYNTARVYTDNIEEEAYKQILNMMNQKFCEGSNVAIMPDTHAGAGCTIGTTMTINDKIVPNLVGVDVGCGMLVLKVARNFLFDLARLDMIVRDRIPSGMNYRNAAHRFAKCTKIEDILAPINTGRCMMSVGTLGGGNHFIEVDEDEDGIRYIVIHSGSRHLGVEICRHYQDKAIKYHSKNDAARNEIIRRCKDEGRQADIEKELKSFNERTEKIPNELAYLEGKDMEDYIHDMAIAQRYAMYNREAMMDEIIRGLEIPEDAILDKFCTIHNYIDTKSMILRKGAISLNKDEVAIIPISMAYGSLIVRGKGNSEWNFSGPHGAGRLMSRSKAKETLNMDDFRESMKGIFTTCISQSTIDESAMAYKPADEIIGNIGPTAEIINIVKPVYNFKASE